MKKTLLVVGGGIEALPGIRLAKEMGLHVVVSDQNLDAPGFALADDRLIIDTYDAQGTVEAAKQYHQHSRPIHGVMCIACDVPATVAQVAEALNLVGIPTESARLSMDKLAMKKHFSDGGLPVPWFAGVESADHLRDIVLREGFPLVIKPVDSRGARGVLRLMPGLDLNWAYHFSFRHSPSRRVIVERFLEGPQFSTETMMLEGVAHTSGFSDRNYEYLEQYAPHIIENGGELPSRLDPAVQQAVHNVVEQAALRMGIVNGVVKGDIVVYKGQPYIIELAARLSGGYFCTHEIPLSTGVEFVKQAIFLALGMTPNPLDLVPRFQKPVAQRFLFPDPGRVVHISKAADLAQQPGVEFFQINVDVGDEIRSMDSHPDRAGVVIASGATREEAIHHASAAVQSIHIETIPVA